LQHEYKEPICYRKKANRINSACYINYQHETLFAILQAIVQAILVKSYGNL